MPERDETMGFYNRYILPYGLKKAMGNEVITKQREKVVPLAEGRVLEIGMGAGHNIPYYDPAKVEMVWGLEPEEPMRKLARPLAEAAPFPVEFLDLPGEEIPLDDSSADTVLVTYTLCTIPDVLKALQGMRRVLKPDAKLIFCEHGKAPDQSVLKWQNRLTPMWKKIGGGCHLNRDIPEVISQGGFAVEQLDAMYLPKTPKFMGFNYWGWAKAR